MNLPGSPRVAAEGPSPGPGILLNAVITGLCRAEHPGGGWVLGGRCTLRHISDNPFWAFSGESVLYLEEFQPMIALKILLTKGERLRNACEPFLGCT